MNWGVSQVYICTKCSLCLNYCYYCFWSSHPCSSVYQFPVLLTSLQALQFLKLCRYFLLALASFPLPHTLEVYFLFICYMDDQLFFVIIKNSLHLVSRWSAVVVLLMLDVCTLINIYRGLQRETEWQKQRSRLAPSFGKDDKMHANRAEGELLGEEGEAQRSFSYARQLNCFEGGGGSLRVCSSYNKCEIRWDSWTTSTIGRFISNLQLYLR